MWMWGSGARAWSSRRRRAGRLQLPVLRRRARHHHATGRRRGAADRLLIAATHCDPTINLYSAYHFVGHNGGVRTVPVLGRH
jgi:D-serine deaminase-like pyridoxal phosphate-dependent protein